MKKRSFCKAIVLGASVGGILYLLTPEGRQQMKMKRFKARVTRRKIVKHPHQFSLTVEQKIDSAAKLASEGLDFIYELADQAEEIIDSLDRS